MRHPLTSKPAKNFPATEPSIIRPMNTCGTAALCTNTIESFFAIMKRGVYGNFHSVSETHLPRYLSEFDFKYNHRSALGYNDAEHADALLRGAKGKRLLYRQPDDASHT